MAVSSDTGLIGGDEGGTMDDLDLGCDDDLLNIGRNMNIDHRSTATTTAPIPRHDDVED